MFWYCGMWNLSFLPRDWTPTPCTARSLNHWTTREVPVHHILIIYCVQGTVFAIAVLSCSVMSDSWWPHGLHRLLCPWGFSRQEHWSGLPFPSPGDLPNPENELRSPTLQVNSLPSEPTGKPKNTRVGSLSLLQGIFLAQEWNWDFLHCRQIFTSGATREARIYHYIYVKKENSEHTRPGSCRCRPQPLSGWPSVWAVLDFQDLTWNIVQEPFPDRFPLVLLSLSELMVPHI